MKPDTDSSGVLQEINGNENLLVAFGGIRQGLGIPVFEFFNSLKNIPCDKLFFRDFNQAWYQKGVDEELTSIDTIVAYLKKTIEENKYKKVCFLGNSMGGFAAILFGTLLNVDVVYAFAPQTFVDSKNRLFNFDFRWRKQVKGIGKVENKNYIDLKKHLQAVKFQGKIEVYYSKKDRLDKLHALRLNGLPGIHLTEYNKGGHDIIKSLRDEGTLNELILQSFK